MRHYFNYDFLVRLSVYDQGKDTRYGQGKGSGEGFGNGNGDGRGLSFDHCSYDGKGSGCGYWMKVSGNDHYDENY